MWEDIGGGANDDYFYEKLDERLAAQRAKQQARNENLSDFQVQTPEQIKEVLYFYEKLDERLATQRAKHQARNESLSDFQVQTPEQIKEVLKFTVDISGRELCVFIGLLIASTIASK
ncbi:hypothetical protein PHMEG_00014288 [Phytophthora megakarya]|uniref:Uncharacterized protein n=1 Tax=Phytophthora megakarya TaxID=4795 RepID=A0A225W4B7_9STRA|nr:hypothetical protein PHMEG_00014288 [Phytophthora megakarya]